MAVAGCVLDDAPPPPELREARIIERWGLPNAGGTLDQPFGLLDRCTHVLDAYACLNAYKRSTGNAVGWTKMNPDGWNFVSYVLAERMERRKNGQ